MSNQTTVLIVELEESLAELDRLVLYDAGYHAIPTVCGSDSMQQVQQINPDVIVLDLGVHAKTCGWHLLEELRASQDTQGIPLLVISDTEELLENAKQSFNVRQEMIKPFDIEDLVQGVRAAVAGTPLLPHPAPQPTQGKLYTNAAQVISAEGGTIMSEWLKRVQHERVLGSPPNVPARVLMGNISVWTMGLVSVLRYGESYLGTSEIDQKLAAHIREAERYGVTLGQVIKQFEILRDLIWETLENSSLAELTTPDVFQLGKTVSRALDEVLRQVATQYMEHPGPTTRKATGT
ncbi:MAG: response regulator [Chloroflexota bacterium]